MEKIILEIENEIAATIKEMESAGKLYRQIEKPGTEKQAAHRAYCKLQRKSRLLYEIKDKVSNFS